MNMILVVQTGIELVENSQMQREGNTKYMLRIRGKPNACIFFPAHYLATKGRFPDPKRPWL